MLRGVDVSSWQEGIDIANLDADFVIVKATGGAGYTNPCFRAQADATLASGKLLACYHFANDDGWSDPDTEADRFLEAVRPYHGRFIPVLDWEGDALANDPSWALRWLQRVSEGTGATPWFYSYSNYLNNTDLSMLAGYPLWLAAYYNGYEPMGYQADPPLYGGTGNWERMTCYQYSSTGRVSGYSGNLDINAFYGDRSDWIEMQGGKMNRNAEMVDLLMPIATNYVFGGTRYDVYDTDCSGIVCGAFYKVFGLDPYTLGDFTGSQWSWGTLAKLWWGTTPDLPWDMMEKGDVIFTSNCSPDFSTGQGSHVGFYTGDPNAPFLSHYANGGPYVTAVNGVYGGTEKYFGVARYLPGLEEDMRPAEVWEYNYNETAVYGNMYNAMNCTAQAVLEGHESAAGDGTVGSMKDRIDWIDMRVREMSEAVEEIKAALSNQVPAELEAAEIDYGKVAEAIADKLAERMRD